MIIFERLSWSLILLLVRDLSIRQYLLVKFYYLSPLVCRLVVTRSYGYDYRYSQAFERRQRFMRWSQIRTSKKLLELRDIDIPQDCAINASGTTSSESYAISRVLDSFRYRSEKPFRNPQGETGRYFSEGLIQSKGEKGKSILFFCIPYASLEKIENQSSAVHTGNHVTRTLLQTLFSSAGRDRELKQAVCHLPQTPKQHCFHVPQLWCLVVGEGTSNTS
jgi:hypothetical protein